MVLTLPLEMLVRPRLMSEPQCFTVLISRMRLVFVFTLSTPTFLSTSTCMNFLSELRGCN